MRTTTLDRINRLSAERAQLYRQVSNHRLASSDARRRIDEVTGELETLWQQRRQERAGRQEGIDLFVHRAYERLYGGDFDDAVAPAPVGAAEDGAVSVAA